MALTRTQAQPTHYDSIQFDASMNICTWLGPFASQAGLLRIPATPLVVSSVSVVSSTFADDEKSTTSALTFKSKQQSSRHSLSSKSGLARQTTRLATVNNSATTDAKSTRLASFLNLVLYGDHLVVTHKGTTNSKVRYRFKVESKASSAVVVKKLKRSWQPALLRM
ncbi:hypothetical protein K493DRAFT_304404 [Basidiobolus meristosporus CBS 931.73]|uniref:Uncharacterized protein n=1 Tax=Basidiobolus meristosporus CBS 931.73 TaxID=1314790 RepID=A0A1Y1XZ88_9FUNG|nr:hypothetical protein K493DRAFT_304404 [Basidiobolus meristosporus CBS 931.73]|eukprot:ORX91051.1 hypothetical protein K493DRAFT_304404 [Basidiobolus meristosporus CBS 931.73]